MIAYVYILAASTDPDGVECSVPCKIDDAEIFFGPCKKKLRQKFRSEYLHDRDSADPSEPTYLIGLNGLGSSRERKIVWVGRVKRLMTFARAWADLVGERYDVMRSDQRGPSPLHIRPIYGDQGKLLGYERRSQLHPVDWFEDVALRNSVRVKLQGEQVLIAENQTEFEAFPRDCCLLLENIFAAEGAGIPIDDAIVEILREAQPTARGVDATAVFGIQDNGVLEGRQGLWLELNHELTARMVQLLPSRVDMAKKAAAARESRTAPLLGNCSCARTSQSACDD